MSIEFDRSYIEEVVMLSGLALFLILAAVMPAGPRRHTVPFIEKIGTPAGQEARLKAVLYLSACIVSLSAVPLPPWRNSMD